MFAVEALRARSVVCDEASEDGVMAVVRGDHARRHALGVFQRRVRAVGQQKGADVRVAAVRGEVHGRAPLAWARRAQIRVRDDQRFDAL